MNKVERFEELKQAIKDALGGKRISEDDLYGIDQVIQERIDAELARPTDEDVQRAIVDVLTEKEVVERYGKFIELAISIPESINIKPFEEVFKQASRYATLRAYRKPTAEEIAEIDKTIDELKRLRIALATSRCDGKRVIDILSPAIEIITDLRKLKGE